MTDTCPYEAARSRVLNTPALHLYQDIVLADWNEGDDHWRWVAAAPLEEIVDWAQTLAAQINGKLAGRRRGRFVGWQRDGVQIDGEEVEGYVEEFYWDGDRYLGPDKYGIEPLYEEIGD